MTGKTAMTPPSNGLWNRLARGLYTILTYGRAKHHLYAIDCMGHTCPRKLYCSPCLIAHETCPNWFMRTYPLQ